jgi:hypothetical protein
MAVAAAAANAGKRCICKLKKARVKTRAYFLFSLTCRYWVPLLYTFNTTAGETENVVALPKRAAALVRGMGEWCAGNASRRNPIFSFYSFRICGIISYQIFLL